MTVLAGVGGYAIASYTAPAAAPATQQAPQAPEAPPAAVEAAVEAPAPEDDWEAWERQYEAEQKQAEREAKLAAKQAADQAKAERQDREKRRAREKKEETARRSQLAPTADTFEALLRGYQTRGSSTDSFDPLRSDLFWLASEIKQREGVEAVGAACDRVYGPYGGEEAEKQIRAGAFGSHQADVCPAQYERTRGL